MVSMMDQGSISAKAFARTTAEYSVNVKVTSKSCKKIFMVCLKVFFSEVPFLLGEKIKLYFNFLTNLLYLIIVLCLGEI